MPEQSLALSSDVINHLTTTLESKDGKWVLSVRENGGCEVALTESKDDLAKTHVIDRTYIEDGIRWIIDYKTTRFVSGQDEAGMDEIALNYHGQLERYKALFATSEYPVKLAIFFTSVGRLAEVE
jgi:hypothetical protein